MQSSKLNYIVLSVNYACRNVHQRGDGLEAIREADGIQPAVWGSPQDKITRGKQGGNPANGHTATGCVVPRGPWESRSPRGRPNSKTTAGMGQ